MGVNVEHCIICRKKTNDFSDEHVIPDSLGGYYHIYCVCKNCNSNLGLKVDSNLVNHKFSDFQRYLLDIKGKSGKIPNPFSGTHTFTNEPNKKVQIRVDDARKITPYIIPSINHSKDDELVEYINIVVDAIDENKLDEIIKKTAKRIGMPHERISIKEKSFQSAPCPEVHIQLSIDLHDFKIGLLKIAYEFAVDSIPEYYNDPMAIDISNVLHSANNERSTDFVNIGNGFQHLVMQPFKDLLDFDSEKHYLILIESNNKLLCFIKLYNLFTVGVTLSEKSYLGENFIVGINDIIGKSFVKLNALEVIEKTHSKPEMRFQYLFKDQESINKFHDLENDLDFGFYMENDEIPLFNKDGLHSGKTVHKKIAELVETSTSGILKCGGMYTNVEIDEELYIKITPSHKLLRIVSIQEERRKICKL